MVVEDGRENVNLEGIWEGVDISDEEIEEAKRSLFKSAYSDDWE